MDEAAYNDWSSYHINNISKIIKSIYRLKGCDRINVIKDLFNYIMSPNIFYKIIIPNKRLLEILRYKLEQFVEEEPNIFRLYMNEFNILVSNYMEYQNINFNSKM